MFALKTSSTSQPRYRCIGCIILAPDCVPAMEKGDSRLHISEGIVDAKNTAGLPQLPSASAIPTIASYGNFDPAVGSAAPPRTGAIAETYTDKVLREFEAKEDKLKKRLQDVIGMEDVKRSLHKLLSEAIDRELKARNNMPVLNRPIHFAFMGNPGTGKSMIAMTVAEVLRDFELSSTANVEVVSSGMQLTAGYVGQTKTKVDDLFKKAEGGVLFIDEAYTLTSPAAAQGSSSFSSEGNQWRIAVV